MAIGDDAVSEGYTLVPESGENGRVRWGSRELNRTRDFIAQVKKTIPKTKASYRIASGITSGTANPSGGSNGDIYIKIIG